jgi:hypothetical protein
MNQSDKPILDYALPPPPLRRRDSLEYYREPPPMANWDVRNFLAWLIAFFVIGIPIVLGVLRFFSDSPL